MASAQCSSPGGAEAHVKCGMTAAYLCQRDMLLLWAGAARRGLQVSGVRQPEVLRCTQVLLACTCAWQHHT